MPGNGKGAGYSPVDLHGDGEHYYSPQPGSDYKEISVQVALRGRELTLLSATGVFSKKRVDKGTALLAEQMAVPKEGRFLDLGCGYGVLGILAALEAPDLQVYMVDLNERAVELARRNAASLELSHVKVMASDGFADLADLGFDVIVTNPPLRTGREKVLQLLRDALSHLNPQGMLFFVARTKQGAKRLAEDLGACGCLVTLVGRGSGYRVYKATPSQD